MVSDVTISGAAADLRKTEKQTLGLTQDFDQFLKLLTTQLQNQDPLNPMDSSEFTNQIVQFSQVEQQINLNQKIADLVSLQLASVSNTALGYVGLDVSYRSAEMNFDGDTPIKISYALDQDTLKATINIIDEGGNLVFTNAVPSEAGAHDFVWNGAHVGGGIVESGTYSVHIDAINSDNKPLDISTVVTGLVRGIETHDGLVFLLIGERAVALNNVINATLPNTNTDSQPEDSPLEEGVL